MVYHWVPTYQRLWSDCVDVLMYICFPYVTLQIWTVLRGACGWLGWVGVSFGYSFTRKWQRPFLNQRKRQNERRKYFLSSLQERMLQVPTGIEPATSWITSWTCMPAGVGGGGGGWGRRGRLMAYTDRESPKQWCAFGILIIAFAVHFQTPIMKTCLFEYIENFTIKI